jgi:hypothetical protein
LAQRKAIRVFKFTDQSWYPSYKLASYKLDGYYKGLADRLLVEVSFLQLTDGDWRVCVWGADDFGKEKDFPVKDRQAAWDLFVKVISQESVNVEYLKDLGFKNV